MLKNAARNFTLALTLVVLTAPVGRAFAQSATAPPSSPGVVTGTNPEPQGTGIGQMILVFLLFA
jgi:hypothetical protein